MLDENDLLFFKSCMWILVNLLGYRSNITEDQFFKYGFAEMKMLLTCDLICLVKQKEKHLKVRRNLTATRIVSKSQMRQSRFT